MKQEELILDAFYAVHYKDELSPYIFQNVITKNSTNSQPFIKTKRYGKGSLHGKHNKPFDGADYRIATAQEITHLKACIAADTYVEAPKPEIINDYEIY